MSVVALAVGISWWISRRLSHRDSWLVVLDRPNERSLHHIPTPRTGGLAIMVGLFVGMGTATSSQVLFGPAGETEGGEWGLLGWIMTAMAVLALVSFVDDKRGLPITARFGIQLVVAVYLVYAAQLSLTTVPIPGFGEVGLGWCSAAVSIAFLMWMTNLYNFMDGMDGFAGGMTVVGGISLAFLTLKTNPSMSLFVLLMAGAAAGFLVYNFPPARIFMGDVGSIPIGIGYGALMLLGSQERLFDIWVPLIIFSPFIVDATVTLLRRVFMRERIWEAHRSHFYQRVVLLGWGHRKTVLAEYGVMLVCATLAWLYQFGSDQLRMGILLGWGLLFTGLMVGVMMAERAMREKQLTV